MDKDGVERVTFDDAGKALVAVDSDGGRHRVEVLPSEGPEILKTLRKKDIQFAVQPLNDFENLPDKQRRKPKRRLIKQHKFGLHHKRATDRQHLLLAARKIDSLVIV